MSRVRQIIGYVTIIFCLTGCGDADLLRLDKLGKPEGWEPDFSLLVAHASFSVWDAFSQGNPDSTTLKKDENGQLYFEFGKSQIYTLEVDSIYRMPLEDMYFNFSFPMIARHFEDGSGTSEHPHYDTLREVYSLKNIPPGVFLEDVIVSMKSMGVTIVNNAHIGGSLKVVCMNLYNLQPVGLINFTVDFTADMPSKMFYTELPSVHAAMKRNRVVPIEVYLMVTDISKADMNENVMIEMSATGVNNKSVTLLLPRQEFRIREGFFKPDVRLLNSLSGKFRFTRPELCLNARTKGFGMKFNLGKMKFTTMNETGEVTLQKNDGNFEFAGNSENQFYKNNYLSYTTGNSNIVDFAALPPRNGITYSGGKVVCGGEVVTISAGGKMEMDLAMRYPLEMTATELIFCDTIADLNLKDSDKAKQARLKIFGSNGLKMNILLTELEFLDENKKSLSRIGNKNMTGFPAATAQGPAEGSVEIELTEADLQNLAKAKYTVLKLSLKTPNGESVNIDDQAKLNLKFLLEARVNIGDVI